LGSADGLAIFVNDPASKCGVDRWTTGEKTVFVAGYKDTGE